MFFLWFDRLGHPCPGPDCGRPATSHRISALVLALETTTQAELQPAAAAPKLRQPTGGSGLM